MRRWSWLKSKIVAYGYEFLAIFSLMCTYGVNMAEFVTPMLLCAGLARMGSRGLVRMIPDTPLR